MSASPGMGPPAERIRMYPGQRRREISQFTALAGAAWNGLEETEMPGIVIYHEMRADEGFLTTAGMLWVMIRDAATRFPGSPRELVLAIEAHGTPDLDDEAREVISFTRAALGPFLTTAPWGKTDEDAPQSEALPGVIITTGDNGRPCVLTGDRDNPVAGPGTEVHGPITAAIYVRTHTGEQETRS